jgi:hypothetical protein
VTRIRYGIIFHDFRERVFRVLCVATIEVNIMVMRDPKSGFAIKQVKMKPAGRGLVSQAGLQVLLAIVDSTDLGEELARCLPEEGSNRSHESYKLALLIVAGLLSGHECLDDIIEFADDDLIETLFNGSLPTAKTLGNFLRRFESAHIQALKLFITKLGFTLRDHVQKVHTHKGEATPHFKIDGTTHEQHGSKMEGCGWITTSENKTVYGYASQTVFDELGFCYAGELLAAAHPRGDAAKLIEQVLSPMRAKKVQSPFEKIADISGDSAYLTQDVIRAATSNHATFTIAAPRTIGWHQNLEQEAWQDWQYTEAELKKLEKKKQQPPATLLARRHWQPSWAEGKLMFPVVIKKQWREDEVMGEACGSWHFHAVCTNRDLTKMSYEQVINAYKPRAEVENQIKEFKYNFDAKHLPCLKLAANEVYFLFVLISQNLIRWTAIIEQPDKPHYAKKIRRKLINAPALLLKGSRQLVMRVKDKFYKEVMRFLEAWGSEPVIIPPLQFSTE